MHKNSATGALRVLRPGDVISTAAYFHEPQDFLSKLHLAAADIPGLTLWTSNILKEYPILREHCASLTWLSSFYEKNARAAHDSGRVTYVPSDLHMTGRMMVSSRKPTVFVAAVPPMEADGTYCISTSNQWEPECIEAAERIILEVNPALPHTDSTVRIPADRVTYAYASNSPLPLYPSGAFSGEEASMAGFVAELVRDGDCVQFGLGGTPDAVANALMEKRDLGIHTEMLGNTMVKLIRSGAVTNRKKTLHPGKTVCAFSLGDQATLNFLNHNHDILFQPVAYVNDPGIIAQNENMVSINTAIQVDLLGQVCSETIENRQYSGAGGAMDFAYGATHAKNGRSIIVVRSTAKGGQASRVRATLPPGSAVTIPRNTVDYVVTEFGVAKLRGASVGRRVEELIAIAHPDFREDLRREARRLMLW